ncbi:unnamed protein product [Adineta ricciae]|uniref:NAD(P)(+)--arginine ADP-ribosyltransferase n=1 Tax=Adineta ricciae TaxID=249248 RepID=A0A816C3V1_ADIRI|nr:unnamed protein product [Adineta ricciae]
MSKTQFKYSIVSTQNDDYITSEQKDIIENKDNVSDDWNTLQTEGSLHWTFDTWVARKFTIVWLNSNTQHLYSVLDKDSVVTKLRDVTSSFHIFNDVDECVDFMTDVVDKDVFLIISNQQIQQLLSLVENIPQLVSIYIFDYEQIQNDQQANSYKKVQGVFPDFSIMINALKQRASRRLVDSTSFSIIVPAASAPNLDQLDQSFMYTQLLKEIILELENDHNSRQAFTDFCLQHLQEYDLRKQPLVQFQKFYDRHSPIWWYTKETFVYTTLNNALRAQDTEMLIKMGFFLRDLHEEIKQNYQGSSHSPKMIVYRGQGMKSADVDKIRNGKGGLLAFNCFLSTSEDREVSYTYAESARGNMVQHGVLFRIQIDPSIFSVPYVSVSRLSQFGEENEILFSMHTVFRINEINEIGDRLYQVELTLTNDNDPELKVLTDCLRMEIGTMNGWHRLGALMQTMGRYDKALEIFDILIKKPSNDDEDEDEFNRIMADFSINSVHCLMGKYSKSLERLEHMLETYRDEISTDSVFFMLIYLQLGEVYRSMGNYPTALSYYEKVLETAQKYLHDHSSLGILYNNLGLIYCSNGNYTAALSHFEKAIRVIRKCLPNNHPAFAMHYNNIAMVHQLIGNYTAALPYLEKAIEINQRALPPDHPYLARSYNSIAAVHQSLGNYTAALSYLEKAIEINQRALPPDHPDLARNYNGIAVVHQSIGNYTAALQYLEKAIEIYKKSLPPDHRDLARSYNNIAMAHQSIGNYTAALPYLEKAIEIYQKSLPPDHPDLAMSYNNIAAVHQSIGNYTAALQYLEKAIEIYEKALPPDHPDLARSYNNIAVVHQSIGNYTAALACLEKAIKINQRALPPDRPDLAGNYNSIAVVHQSIGNYTAALQYLEKAIKINQRALPPDHPDLARSYNGIAVVHQSIGNYTAALQYLEKAIKINQKSLLPDHPDLARSYNGIAVVHQSIGNYTAALQYLEKAIEIYEKALPPDHRDLARSYNNIAMAHQSIGNYTAALSYLEKAIEIYQKSLPPDHPDLAMSYNNIAAVHQSIGNYTAALPYLEKAIEICQKSLPPDHPDLAANYLNIGTIQRLSGNYSVALSYFDKMLKISQHSLPDNHVNTALCYIAIGDTYQSLGNYSQALSYFEKSLAMLQITLPHDHPHMSHIYARIVYISQLTNDRMCVIDNLEKVAAMQQKFVADNEQLFRSSSCDPQKMRECTNHFVEAMSQMKNAVKLRRKLSSSPEIISDTTGGSTDNLKHVLKNYIAGLSNLESIFQTMSQASSMERSWLYGNTMNAADQDQFSECMQKFILYMRRGFETLGNLSSSQKTAASSGDDIDHVMKLYVRETLTALSYYSKTLEVRQKYLPPNDPSVATEYNNIGTKLCGLDENQEALSYFEKALELMHKSLPNNHSLLAKTLSNMSNALADLGRYPEATDYAWHAVEIAHSSLEINQNEIAEYEYRLEQLLALTS